MLERTSPTQLTLPVPAGRWIDHRDELQRGEWFAVERHRSQRHFRVPVAVSRRAFDASVHGLLPEHRPLSDEEADQRFDHLLLCVALWSRVAWQGAGPRDCEGQCRFSPVARPGERHLPRFAYTVDLWVRRRIRRGEEPWILIARDSDRKSSAEEERSC